MEGAPEPPSPASGTPERLLSLIIEPSMIVLLWKPSLLDVLLSSGSRAFFPQLLLGGRGGASLRSGAPGAKREMSLTSFLK